jgi:uncharacterized protein (TIGR00369 family)
MYFNQYIGMTGSDDFHEAFIEIEDHHQNPTGNINGGVIISLADNLSTGVANHYYREKFGTEVFMVGVDLHASMLSNQNGGRIKARAEPVRVGKRVTVIRTKITGYEDRLLAEITTTHVPVDNAGTH